MGRRDRDERPAIEIVGGEPAITSLEHVSTEGAGGSRRRRGRLAAAVVLGVLAAVLAFGGDDDGSPAASGTTEEETTTSRERSTTTRPRPTTTSTTTPSGPVFDGLGLSGWLLSGNVDGWTLVDIASGARSTPRLPFDDPYSTRAVTGGVLTVSSGQVEYHDLRIPEGVREPVSLGPADQVIAAAQPDQIWLLEGIFDPPTRDGGRARLVDLGGREVRSFPIPEASYSSATADGLLFERGGRVFRVDESGATALAVGQLIGSVGSSFLVLTCDERAACGIDLRSASGGLIRRLDSDGGSPEAGASVWSDALGRFALLTYAVTDDFSDSVLALFDADGRLIDEVESIDGPLSGPLSWLPGDAGLVGARNGRIVWIRASAEGWIVEDLPIPDPVQSEGVLAIVT